jgi:hypothetical protein
VDGVVPRRGAGVLGGVAADFADRAADAADSAADVADRLGRELSSILPLAERNDDIALLVIKICEPGDALGT